MEEESLEERLKFLRLERKKLMKQLDDLDTELGWVLLQIDKANPNRRSLK